jgi:hypothetical protein
MPPKKAATDTPLIVASWWPESLRLAKVSRTKTTREKQRKIPPIPIKNAAKPERINFLRVWTIVRVWLEDY